MEEKLIKMKIFVYKALFVLIGLFFLLNFTIGYQIRKIENNISNINSEENIKFFKEKIKEEIEAGLEKDQILNEEERLLISRFLKKIILELELNK